MGRFELPTRDHPIYMEWRKWRNECDRDFSEKAIAVLRSIERIAEATYPEYPTVVGFMIIMNSLQCVEEGMSKK